VGISGAAGIGEQGKSPCGYTSEDFDDLQTSVPHPPTSSAPFAQKDGKGAGLVLPSCNTEAMTRNLADIATQVAQGAHAVFLVDQAGGRLSSRLDVDAMEVVRPGLS
jgi:hypothetical protein